MVVVGRAIYQVTNPQIFDALLRPLRGGLYDPRLGPFDKNDNLFRYDNRTVSARGWANRLRLGWLRWRDRRAGGN